MKYSGSGLFNVDNSISGRTAHGYPDGYSEHAESVEIATGPFLIGTPLALDDNWQSLKQIHIRWTRAAGPRAQGLV